MKLHDFVREYQEALPLSVCKDLIDTFESSPHQEVVDNDYKPFFTELNVTRNYQEWYKPLVDHTLHILDMYRFTHKDYTDYFQGKLGMEEFRIKRYNSETGEQFDTHVDACTKESSKRYLSFLFYLNDDFTGGETVFHPDKTVTPKAGSVLVFPPTWQYPHAGLPLITGTKYILSTYLNFV